MTLPRFLHLQQHMPDGKLRPILLDRERKKQYSPSWTSRDAEKVSIWCINKQDDIEVQEFVQKQE